MVQYQIKLKKYRSPHLNIKPPNDHFLKGEMWTYQVKIGTAVTGMHYHVQLTVT